MRRIYFIALSVLMMSSCAPLYHVEIGKVNMISTRNVDSSAEYVQLQTYSGGTKKDIRDAKKDAIITIEDAINKTVRNVPGGEYMQNVKILLVENKYIAVEGDVWGYANQSYKGIAIGDKIKYKSKLTWENGEVVAFIDRKKILIKNSNGKEIEVNIEDVVKGDN